MKRALVSTVIAALPLAASGQPSERNYSGTVERSGTLDLTALVSHGRVGRVGAFSYSGVTTTCRAGRQGTFEGGTTRFVRVRKRKFYAGFWADRGSEYVVIRGALAPTGKTIAGAIQITGDVSSKLRRCDTGIDSFKTRAVKPA